MSPEQYIRALREQIERQDAHTEMECGEHVKHLGFVLLPQWDGTIIYVDQEQLTSAGRVDVIVLADVIRAGGDVCREAYVWELKAPQLFLFRMETNNQACPYRELFQAENQLIHYHHSVANSGHLRERWGILSPNHVRFGGIIIGRDAKLVRARNNVEHMIARQLASQALEIRKNVFYRPNNIRLWTWDKVLSIAENFTASHQRRTDAPDTVLEVRRTVHLTGTLVPELEEEICE